MVATSQTKTIDLSELECADKWLVNYFLSSKKLDPAIKVPLVPLSELVVERNQTIDPQKYPEWDFLYLGLENIESTTGTLTNLIQKRGVEIKSRSKVFHGGDLLYGKLRPSLNKVCLLPKNIGSGICSTEILVLEVKSELISPSILRFMLSTEHVVAQVRAFTGGTALPRIHVDDLLSIKIPVPDKKSSTALEKELHRLNIEIEQARDLIKSSGQILESIYSASINSEPFSYYKKSNSKAALKILGELPEY